MSIYKVIVCCSHISSLWLCKCSITDEIFSGSSSLTSDTCLGIYFLQAAAETVVYHLTAFTALSLPGITEPHGTCSYFPDLLQTHGKRFEFTFCEDVYSTAQFFTSCSAPSALKRNRLFFWECVHKTFWGSLFPTRFTVLSQVWWDTAKAERI